jgi:hypothetical protein
MNPIAKWAIGIVTPLIVSLLVWGSAQVYDNIVWASELAPIESNQKAIQHSLQTLVRDGLESELRELRKEIRSLERLRDQEGWTDSDEKYFQSLLEAMEEIEDELDDGET